MKKLVAIGFVVALTLTIAGCGGGSQYLQDGKIKQSIDQTNETDKYLIAVGLGAPSKDATDSTQRKATSRNAAIVAAQYDLVGRVKGVKIEGGVTIQKAMETDSKISAIVNDSVMGAEVSKTEWTADDGCIITMRLDKQKLAQQLNTKIE
ncbi:MAG: hypothetical protein A2452_10030 [Candidatus Firestonebacteria bacterium RIFOXYC2_FULL_39_67]|nr:MAG: hypothetical protein A2536_10095 [Candidatus Firestonebacteria bacterium RIFOXYD2_FULL_39_29]OGF55233.1 MAG: hypothetical protein A2452_10030 [Candidatus Firestonebacteria bacterium RIFOXYC2_FULL_39_67]